MCMFMCTVKGYICTCTCTCALVLHVHVHHVHVYVYKYMDTETVFTCCYAPIIVPHNPCGIDCSTCANEIK